MELRPSCTNPSICHYEYAYTIVASFVYTPFEKSNGRFHFREFWLVYFANRSAMFCNNVYCFVFVRIMKNIFISLQNKFMALVHILENHKPINIGYCNRLSTIQCMFKWGRPVMRWRCHRDSLNGNEGCRHISWLQILVRTICDIIARYGEYLPRTRQPGISSARLGRGWATWGQSKWST